MLLTREAFTAATDKVTPALVAFLPACFSHSHQIAEMLHVGVFIIACLSPGE